MAEADKAIALRLYGTSQPVPPSRRLVAGELSCLLDGSAIRAVSWRGIEVIRGVAYLLRDVQWGTATAEVRDLTVEEGDGGFEIRFELVMAQGAARLTGQARIRGTAQGEFSFAMQAASDMALRTNRCGFVVLHPADVAGSPLTVEHTDGSVDEWAFPALISPSQPVFDIRRLRHRPVPGLVVDCLLQAELPNDPAGKFEMEDQRNWSDASFKTYVGSLFDTWPYEWPACHPLRQSVVVRITDEHVAHGTAAHHRPDRSQASAVMEPLRVGPETGARMPAIGLGVPPSLQRLLAHERKAATALRPAWLQAEVELSTVAEAGDGALSESLRAIRQLGADCGARVQLDVLCPARLSPADAAAHLARACDTLGWQPEALRPLPVPYLKSYQPQGQWPSLPGLELYAQAMAAALPASRVGGGMLTYFTELNRKRPPANGLHFIGHTSCPIVHAADDLSVMETLQTLPHIARSVQAAWPGLAYRLGPLSLAMHRNPYGEGPAANPRRERIAMADDDPRHQAAFGAAWLVGCAAAMAPFGLEVLSLNHSHGSSGPLLQSDQPGWQPGACVPAWGVQQVLARASGAAVLALEGLPQGFCGLAWRSADGVPFALLANLGSQPRELGLHGAWRVRRLDVPVPAEALQAPGSISIAAASDANAAPPMARPVNGSLHCAPLEVALLQP